jgi:hypothetical protein
MGASAVGVMLNQDQLVFTKGMSRSELSTVFLRDLRRAVVAATKKKTSVVPRATLH